MMQDLVGIVRVESELSVALQKIEQLKLRAAKAACGGNRGYNPGWHTAIELKHMLTVAEAITLAAIERKESRGGHFRDDFPDKSEELGGMNISVAKAEGGKMIRKRIPKVKMRDDLQQIIEENK
jgi:succinate dehydrogenase / fumarate reductase flavoprotein subunit